MTRPTCCNASSRDQIQTLAQLYCAAYLGHALLYIYQVATEAAVMAGRMEDMAFGDDGIGSGGGAGGGSGDGSD